MNERWAALLAAPVIVSAPVVHATVYLSVEQAQQVLFRGATFSRLDLARREQVWRVSPQGWFVVDKVLGKREMITYAVGLDAQGRVRGVEILEYLESHGGEVRNADWRAQFVGKSARDPLQLDRDIRNISGATLSSHHLTEGVKRVLNLYGHGVR